MDFAATVSDSSQRLWALDRANRVRGARAQLKQRIAAGEVTVAEVILAPRREIEGMSIAAVLVSQRLWGERRSREFLAGLGMPESKTVGSMTERQRIAVAAALTRTRASSS